MEAIEQAIQDLMDAIMGFLTRLLEMLADIFAGFSFD